MRKVYIFVFTDAIGGKDAIRRWAALDPNVLHWRTDMPHLFYIVSEASAAVLSAEFIKHNGKKGRFLLAEVTDNRQGLLPKESWYLLRNKRQMPAA